MQKAAVVYREPLQVGGTADLVRHVRDRVAHVCHGATLHVQSRALPADIIAAGGLDTTLAAALMLWIDRPEDLDAIDAELDAVGPSRDTYLLAESVMREYRCIDWPLGEPSPGVTLFALLHKRQALTDREFHERWQRHSTLSLRVHPLTRYHRNAVLRAVGRTERNCDGIVEERVATLADLAPERFYIGEGARDRAVDSLNEYVDLAAGGLTCALMEEFLIKLPSWVAPLVRTGTTKN
jgi:hypothetical protein